MSEDKYRSAVTGRYVSEKFAEEHPRQTVKEEGEKLSASEADEPKTREEEKAEVER